MPRTARIVIPGIPHHVTQRGNSRQAVFFVDDDRRGHLSILAEETVAANVTILGSALTNPGSGGNKPPGVRPLLRPGCDLPPWPGNDPTKAPPGTEWRGQPGSTPGHREGSYYNPNTGEGFHPDLSHPDPIGPHRDYVAPDGEQYWNLPDGSVVPK